MKPVGKPDAGNPHVRFDERGWETGRRPASAPAPNLDSTAGVFGRHVHLASAIRNPLPNRKRVSRHQSRCTALCFDSAWVRIREVEAEPVGGTEPGNRLRGGDLPQPDSGPASGGTAALNGRARRPAVALNEIATSPRQSLDFGPLQQSPPHSLDCESDRQYRGISLRVVVVIQRGRSGRRIHAQTWTEGELELGPSSARP